MSAARSHRVRTRLLTALLMPVVILGTTRCQDHDVVGVRPSANDGATRPLLATVGVSSTADAGAGSLRQAIADAAPGDVIDLTGLSGTITLTSGELAIDKDLTILGPGANALTIARAAGAPAFRILHVTGGAVAISGVTISGGAATPAGPGAHTGGGVRVANATLALSDCAVTGNTVTSGIGFGGGLTFFQAAGTIDRCTISGNSVPSIASGGGLTVNTSAVTIVNSTVSGNAAGTGGGGGITIMTSGNGTTSTVDLVASTVAMNTAAPDFGGAASGGIYLFGAGAEVLNLKGAIVADNGVDITRAFPNGADVVTADHSLIETNVVGIVIQPGIGNISIDPQLAPLADNGGPTKTHALGAGSLAIGAGNPATCAAAPVSGKDQRGKLRPAACSMGAYEAKPMTPPPPQSPSLLIVLPGAVNMKGVNGGIVTVAVLSTQGFDAPAQVDPATATLGGPVGPTVGVAKRNDGTLKTGVEDVNGDGVADLTLQFNRDDLVKAGIITPPTAQLVLRALLVDGVTQVEGSAAVKVVP